MIQLLLYISYILTINNCSKHMAKSSQKCFTRQQFQFLPMLDFFIIQPCEMLQKKTGCCPVSDQMTVIVEGRICRGNNKSDTHFCFPWMACFLVFPLLQQERPPLYVTFLIKGKGCGNVTDEEFPSFLVNLTEQSVNCKKSSTVFILQPNSAPVDEMGREMGSTCTEIEGRSFLLYLRSSCCNKDKCYFRTFCITLPIVPKCVLFFFYSRSVFLLL